MLEENEDLAFNVPKEGFNLYIDACCIPKNAQHKEAAELFINFLCEPAISGPNVEYIGYSTPISAAKEYTDEEMTSSEIIYPPEDFLARGESFRSLSTEGMQLMNDLWLAVKTSNSLLFSYLIPVVVVAAILIAWWLISSIRKQRLKSRRCTH